MPPTTAMNGYLVTITSQEENDFIEENISIRSWTGASDARNEGQWIWETGPEAGSALDDGYKNWDSGQPNNHEGKQHYGSIYGSSHNSSGRWNDESIIDLPYIIEYSGSGTSEGDNLINYWLTLGVEDVSLQWLPDNTHKAVVVSDLQAGVDYSLDITGRPTGADPAAVSIDNTGVITVGETASAADGGIYSISAAGEGLYSSTVSASFRLTLSRVVSGLSPADGSSTKDTTPTLSWNAVLGAAGYELQLADSRAGLEASQVQSVTDTSYTFASAITNEQSHYWRVRAVDGGGQKGGWSAVASIQIVVYFVGDTGPAGGIIFYYKGSYSDGWRYLEAAPSDQGRVEWGGYQTSVGGTGTAIGSGKSNTEKIVNKLGSGNYAARLCYDFELGGYDDWFLPSKDELNELYKQKDTVGDFASSYYWSSSELSSSLAWRQGFPNGSQYYYGKYGDNYVRAVRAF